MSGIGINPMLPGRLCFGSPEMSVLQSLCWKYHINMSRMAAKPEKYPKCFQDTL